MNVNGAVESFVEEIAKNLKGDFEVRSRDTTPRFRTEFNKKDGTFKAWYENVEPEPKEFLELTPENVQATTRRLMQLKLAEYLEGLESRVDDLVSRKFDKVIFAVAGLKEDWHEVKFTDKNSALRLALQRRVHARIDNLLDGIDIDAVLDSKRPELLKYINDEVFRYSRNIDYEAANSIRNAMQQRLEDEMDVMISGAFKSEEEVAEDEERALFERLKVKFEGGDE